MSRARAKGTAAETAVADYLRGHGFPHAERRALHGSRDLGDITGVPGVVVEVKAAVSADYGGWLREADAERANAAARLAIVVHKPKGMGVERVRLWRAVTTLETMTALIREDM